MNKALALTAGLLLATPAAGVEIFVQAQNDLQASHDVEIERDIFEDWLDLDLYGDGFQLGMRYSSFAPPDHIVSTDKMASEGITHRFAELSMGDSRLRVGTFTRLFGRGLALRSYENRDLRIDTNLDGFLFEHEGGWWRGTLLNGRAESGQMETGERERDDRFSGVDIGANLGLLELGSSFLSAEVERQGITTRPEIHSLRASLYDGPLDIHWEGARYLQDDGREAGLGQVVEGSLLAGPLSFYAGYKYYRDAAVLTHDQKLMNQPPVLIHDQRATLLNRHPHQLNPDDEKGLLADISARTPLGDFLISYAETQSIDEELRGNDFRESFLEWDHHDILGLESAHFILDFQKVPFLSGSDWTWDYFLSTALDLRIPLASGHLVAIWEHQHKKADHVGEYDDELLTLEYEAAGGWTLSLMGEYLNWTREQQLSEQQTKDRQIWLGLQLATPLGDHHDLRLFVGGRRAGYICVGGVCRYEPAFDGVELALLSRF